MAVTVELRGVVAVLFRLAVSLEVGISRFRMAVLLRVAVLFKKGRWRFK